LVIILNKYSFFNKKCIDLLVMQQTHWLLYKSYQKVSCLQYGNSMLMQQATLASTFVAPLSTVHFSITEQQTYYL
jgi:hypothetical protein